MGMRRHRGHVMALGLLSLGVLGILSVGLVARYVRTSEVEAGAIGAQDFYFGVDLLGDVRMTSCSEDPGVSGACSLDEASEGTWKLYGGEEHLIGFQVRNFADGLRVTDEDIGYRLELVDEDGTGASLQCAADTDASQWAVLDGGSEDFHEVTLSIPAQSASAYEDGTEVQVKVCALSPYARTICLHFVLFGSHRCLCYKVVDSPGSPCAELVVTNTLESDDGTALDVCPRLVWPDDLSIDCTDELCFSLDAQGNVVQPEGLARRDMFLSKSIRSGQSASILFYKEDASQDRSCDSREVEPVGGVYGIDLR